MCVGGHFGLTHTVREREKVMNKLSVATLLGKKNVFVSCAVMNMDEIRIGQNVLKPCASIVSLEIFLASDGSVKLTIDHTRVYSFINKAKATNWLKKEFKPITDLSRLIVHVSETRQNMKFLKRFDAQWAIQEIAEGAIAPRKNKVMRVNFDAVAYYEISDSKRIVGMYDIIFVSSTGREKFQARYTYQGICDFISAHAYIGENFSIENDSNRDSEVYRP